MAKINQFVPGLSSSHQPPTLTAAVADAPAGGTGTAAGGWDTAANRNAAIATINNLKARVAELESALRAIGIIA